VTPTKPTRCRSTAFFRLFLRRIRRQAGHGERLAKLNKFPLLIALSALPLALIGGGCASDLPPPDGVCIVDTTLDCTAGPLPGSTPQDVGLLGYSCTGKARPDENARYNEEVPEGLVCADRGAAVDGKQSYCCSQTTTSCALDPVLPCLGSDFGYQCRGGSRPDVFNAALKCGNGVEDDIYIDYCCSGQPEPPHCTATQGSCGDVLQGFTCPAGVLPVNEDLGANESRADYYRFFCPVPTPAPNIKLNNYCCYMPAPPMTGYSCYQDTVVPGCAGGRFGFACYGYDKPNEDYPPMHCPDPGFQGKSAEGYPATLYCCDGNF